MGEKVRYWYFYSFENSNESCGEQQGDERLKKAYASSDDHLYINMMQWKGKRRKWEQLRHGRDGFWDLCVRPFHNRGDTVNSDINIIMSPYTRWTWVVMGLRLTGGLFWWDCLHLHKSDQCRGVIFRLTTGEPLWISLTQRGGVSLSCYLGSR